jgi:hypothetical protein
MNWRWKEWCNESMKQKVGSLKKINTIGTPLAKLTKKGKKKTWINKIRDEKVDNITDTSEIQKIIWDYFESLYSCKLINEEKIENFLSTYDPLKLIQDDIKNLNRYITRNKIETVMKNLTSKKSASPDRFTTEFF